MFLRKLFCAVKCAGTRIEIAVQLSFRRALRLTLYEHIKTAEQRTNIGPTAVR